MKLVVIFETFYWNTTINAKARGPLKGVQKVPATVALLPCFRRRGTTQVNLIAEGETYIWRRVCHIYDNLRIAYLRSGAQAFTLWCNLRQKWISG